MAGIKFIGSIATIEKRISFFTTKSEIVHEEKVNAKQDRMNEVRNLKSSGCSNREITRRTKLSRNTIRKYLNESTSPIHASYGNKKSGKLVPYIKHIDLYLQNGVMGSKIEENIREMGYSASSSSLRHYMSDWKKRWKFFYDKSKDFDNKTETIERKDIFKLLYNSIEKVKPISQKQFENICNENQYFQKIHQTIWDFKTLFINKNENDLKLWIDKAKKHDISEINSFINGVERDIIAVMNAIKYEYSNGLAEGSVNKLKVIKRIMYGRCNFNTLRNKILKLEKIRKIN